MADLLIYLSGNSYTAVADNDIMYTFAGATTAEQANNVERFARLMASNDEDVLAELMPQLFNGISSNNGYAVMNALLGDTNQLLLDARLVFPPLDNPETETLLAEMMEAGEALLAAL